MFVLAESQQASCKRDLRFDGLGILGLRDLRFEGLGLGI